MNRRQIIVALLFVALPAVSGAQGLLGGTVTGGVQVDCQTGRADSTTGAQAVEEGLLMNARADVLYRNGDFNAGLRVEAYQNPLPGFDSRWKGEGVANWFVGWDGAKAGVTAGWFYEQFGSGLVLRAYEDRYLGLDNALLGMKVWARPWNGVTLKGVIGRQRYFWDIGDGVVRGVDGEVDLRDVAEGLKMKWPERLRLAVGGSFVSRYEGWEQVASGTEGYVLNLPLNVGAAAARLEASYGGWRLQGEYARKGHDPNEMNGYIYREGEALTLTAGYSQKGFSAQLQAKRVDDMGFKSVRSESGEMLFIGYVPSITKNHTYALLTMYPYATQVNGEQGLSADVMYKIAKGTVLGGKYGTDVRLNVSVVAGLDTAQVGGAGTEGYAAGRGIGDLYYGEASLEVERKLSKDLKLTLVGAYQVFNPVVEGGEPGLYHNVVGVADVWWRLGKRHALRLEGEWMVSDSKSDPSDAHMRYRAGDWLTGLVEWSIGRHWFVSARDEWAYADGVGNYYNVSVGYTGGAARLQVGYGKSREGLLCIGGVCRRVPASNGITASLTMSF